MWRDLRRLGPCRCSRRWSRFGKALHDEDETFRAKTRVARAAGDERRYGLDWFRFVVSFKGVFLEGLEIVFIVITFGASADGTGLATVGAVLGGLIVLAAGLALRRTLSRMPEHTIAGRAGTFAPDNVSVQWPGGDLAILALVATWTGLAWLSMRLLRPPAPIQGPPGEPDPPRDRSLLVGLHHR